MMTTNNPNKKLRSDTGIDQGWKFQIGDLVKSEGTYSDGEKWEERLIVLGRCWADEGAARFFDGYEDRIQTGRNYYCKVIGENEFTGFYTQSQLVRITKG